MRHIDVVVLALALLVFIGAALPLVGYAAAAVAWLAQRALQAVLTRRARAAQNAGRMAGIAVGSMIVRSCMVGGGILAAGLVEREAGLAAGVLLVVVFTVYFAMSLILVAFDASHRPAS